MNIAYTMISGRGDIDLLLEAVAAELITKCHHPGGIVQVNTGRAVGGPCDMDVKVLPEGPIIRISQALGSQSKGCRLDASALEEAVAHVETSLGQGTDCLIINKFGKQEATGHGFRSSIAKAISLGIPVLVGLNHLNADAFMEFTGDLVVQLPAQQSELVSWFEGFLCKTNEAA